MNTTPNPLPSDSRPLPPTARDFEIFEQNQVHFLSTRHIAEKHAISQTRVRQIVARVADWLATHLPAKSEAEKEAELRLAQHLAAAQLRRQVEVLKNFFDATGDPKYLRHQSRVIISLARLGVVPGAIDALAADCEDDTSTTDAHRPSPDSSPLSPDPCPLTPAPSLRDCSLPEQQTASDDLAATANHTPTPNHDESYANTPLDPESTLQGLTIMERRLLTLLAETSPDNHDRHQSLQRTLATVRHHKTTLELRLSPDHPGVSSSDPTSAATPAHAAAY